MPQDFYKEDEAEQILRLATRQGLSGGVSREALLRMAGEVGLSVEAVEAAEREIATKNEDVSLAVQFKRKQRTDYIEALAAYATTNAFMIGIWYLTGHGFFWPGFVILGWGIHMVTEIPEHFMPDGSTYQKAFSRWKAKRDRRAAKDQARSEASESRD